MSGISLDGTRYFCVSPLEIDPALVPQRQDHEHVKTERVQQFGCACCQPNIARLVASLGGDIYGPWDAGPAVQHYIESDSRIDLPRGSLRLAQRTNYPWEERVELGLAMPVRMARADRRVSKLVGKVAFQRRRRDARPDTQGAGRHGGTAIGGTVGAPSSGGRAAA